ncbi:MAG TPA: CopD family protein [Stenotrophobium sp.]|jgi:putative membrane protein|nr:CopD family protein [Stenotrophobium sp.]
MLWIKAFHIIFVVTWFAGLFYLPRLFVYHTEISDDAGYQRFCTMERRLFAIMSIGMVGTVALGLWLWLAYWPMQTGWLHAKFGLALLLIGYHHWLIVPMKRFRTRTNTRSAGFYRVINEIPVLFLVAMVILAVVKPF